MVSLQSCLLFKYCFPPQVHPTNKITATTKVTAEEWDNHKDEIVSLYIIEDYPLRLVRQKLAKKGFNPRYIY